MNYESQYYGGLRYGEYEPDASIVIEFYQAPAPTPPPAPVVPDIPPVPYRIVNWRD